MSLSLQKHLIAGKVIMVAMVFESAPNKNAENAERTAGDESFPFEIC